MYLDGIPSSANRGKTFRWDFLPHHGHALDQLAIVDEDRN
jgi:hypothetical protein